MAHPFSTPGAHDAHSPAVRRSAQLVSTRPTDPSPQDPAPQNDDGSTDTPPPGFLRSTKALLANPYAKIVVAIIAILLIVLGIAMVSSISSTSKGPGTGAIDLPSLVQSVWP